jgi:serine/threonine protein phosphatase PrpC
MGFSGVGVKKVNQDNFFVYKNFADDPNSIFMSVCDGHGMYGHEVSGYLKENLPINLSHELKTKRRSSVSGNVNINKIIEEIFLGINSRLFNDANIDTNFSGSTCVSVIYTQEKLLCANVGDSRAVLGRYVDGSNYYYIYI